MSPSEVYCVLWAKTRHELKGQSDKMDALEELYQDYKGLTDG